MKTNKKYAAAAALLTILLSIHGCSAPSDNVPETEAPSSSASEYASTPSSSSPSEAFLVFPNPDMVNQEQLTDFQDYAVLVESYLKDSSFKPVENSRIQSLSLQLDGHYEIAGRTDGNGREYYLALRRTDAPIYDDFLDLSVSYTDGGTSSEQVCQIGYYNETIDPVVLYQLPDFSVNIFGNRETVQSLDMFCFFPYASIDDTAFFYALDENGRLQLDFMKEHPGLSFYTEETDSCIDFLYQDQDTVKFCSEPYSCRISLNQQETEHLKQLLKESQTRPGTKTDFENQGQILDYVRTLDSSIRTTGARFSVEGKTYELLGSSSSAGYMISYDKSEAGERTVNLEYNQPAFLYVVDKIKDVTGVDYGSFSDTWFDLPLISASLDYPNFAALEDGMPVFCVSSQTVLDPEKLAKLSRLLKQAVSGHESLSACPYTGILNLTREDGETLQMFVASDSCDSITYEGRIGFEYGSQKDLADIFDNAMSLQE